MRRTFAPLDCVYSKRNLYSRRLSKPLISNIKNFSDFDGPCFHTSRWPREGLDLTGKPVAVIGTGSSGIQVIEHIASQVRHLTVSQRTLPLSQSLFPDENEGNRPLQSYISSTF
ncbi:hypothetical protein C8R41DRAFT_836833 [Lentinula lateritia]|uniref:L-ornithine N(5)-oxygenase n=1 Tax=Lentinula lateritia TaxID=40482 RepID=A0ABQ8VG61_9AGAR|nr:hypothetical protein C8R41DRAFT_836833 [Lentinula lateritia]